MSATQYDENLFNSEQSDYNSEINNYLTKVNAFKSEYMTKLNAERQKNEALGAMFEGSGLIGMDVVHKITSSKAFALLTVYVKKKLEDPDSMPSKMLGLVKNKLKGVIKSGLGIDLDSPGNAVWKQAYNTMKMSREDLAQLAKGNSGPIQAKLHSQFIAVVEKNYPKILDHVRP